MTKAKGNTKQGKGQSDSQHRQQLREQMEKVGFVAGTQVAYLREFDRFEQKLDRKSGANATVARCASVSVADEAAGCAQGPL